MTYLYNTWYAAAWTAEVGDAPMVRTLLGEKVVLYRGAQEEVLAASDLCPHRFAPLHMGKVVDGAIECPYHGLRFGSDGRCVFNPDGEGRIPAGARLKTYPIVERWGVAWIWMGDADKANPDLIVDFPYLERSESFRPVTGLLHVRANYRYINDNLMDQAHLHMVHNTSLGCDMIRAAKTEVVRQPDGSIWANRYGKDGQPPAIFDMMWRRSKGDYDGTMDHWVEGGWFAPALVKNNTGVALHGGTRESGIETKNAHLLTPETETTTHYFWAIARNFELDNDGLDEEIRMGTEYAFVQEDEIMLHAVQEAIGDRDFWELKPALLQGDTAAVQLRRALDKMIAQEANLPEAEPQLATRLAS